MRPLISLALAAVMFLAAACSSPEPPPVSKKPVKIFITTDIHGHLSFDPDQGQLGLARLQTYIQSTVGQGGIKLLMDSGDAFSGSALAQIDRGRFVAEMMGRMGYLALTPGNHAFDHNEMENNLLHYSDTLLKILRDNSSGPVEVTAVNLSFNGQDVPGTVRRPVVVYDETAGQPEGRRVIVVGVITPYAARASLRDSLVGYDFGRAPGEGPEAAAATRAAILADLTQQLAEYDRPGDTVVILSHVGQEERSDRPEGRLSSLDLAAVPNVDFVADGHSHLAQAPETIGSAVFANGGCYLRSFLEINLEPDGQRMELKTFEQLKDLAPDPDIESRLAEFEERHRLNEILFVSPDANLFSDKGLRTKSLPLGRLIGRTMAEAAGAEAAIYGAGAIRAALPAGPVTARNFYDVVPFGDDLVSGLLTGEEITELFQDFFSDSWRVPQFYGLLLKVQPGAGEGRRPKLLAILDKDGQDLEPQREYRVALSSFMVKGGRLKQLLAGRPLENHGSLAPLLIERLRSARDLNFDQLRADNVLAADWPSPLPLENERPPLPIQP